jgi:predicted O-methyltransferase YrrM
MCAAARAEAKRVGELVRERDDAWALSPHSAQFLHALILSGGQRRGLEIGTSYGYSGLWIGAALAHNGGTLTTIDVNAEKVRAARATFARAELEQAIEVVEGDALEVVSSLSGPFDFVLIDANKEGARAQFEAIWPKLAPRATIVTDNVTSHGEVLADFATYLRARAGVCSVLLPFDSGLEVTVRLDARTDGAAG